MVPIVAGLLVVLVAAWSMVQQNAALNAPLPGPSVQAVPSLTTATPSATTNKPTTTPTPSVVTSTQQPKPLEIESSPVLQIYMPSTHKLMVIDAPVAQMPTSCKKEIDPPRDISRRRGVFQCGDFASAGTNSTGMTVLPGHSSVDQQWNTVFDKLSCTATSCARTTVAEHCSVQRSTLVGRLVYLRTVASGKHWLVYRVTDVFCPSQTIGKDNNVNAKVWKPTPGGLLLITCLEQANQHGSTNSLFVKAQYVEVK